MLNQTIEEPAELQASLVTVSAPVFTEQDGPVESSLSQTMSTAEMKAFLDRLASTNSTVKAEADRQLKAMSVTEVTNFLADSRRYRSARQKRITRISLFVLALITITCIITHQSQMFSYFGAFSGVLGGAAAFSRGHKTTAMVLSQYESVESVGELVSALEIRDTEVQEVIRPALIRLLQKLRASDAELLGTDQRATLKKLLQNKLSGRRYSRPSDRGQDALLIIATLRALSQVGDGSFVTVVTSLANANGAADLPEVAAAARECLPALEEFARHQAQATELVRASQPNDPGAATILLRPVSGVTASVQPGELLRAADTDA